MAHFAQLDVDNKVINVVVIGDQNCLGDGGVESEQVGIDFCRNTFGANTRWLQTSINNRIRKNYAGIGFAYDAVRDAFIPPSPYPSWVLNEETCQWKAPIPKPADVDGIRFIWDEDQGQWVGVELPPEEN